ncbi:MAG: alpha/beta fold hydrolase [Caulobacteraceae bacterium]|nr:alpha/beta fold hydrolase [Caulobacteraceae bacterium]
MEGASEAVEPFETDVGGLTMRGLRARPSGAPRGLVVALHGGGYDCRYWHHPGQAEASLLELGRTLGFDVIALDRPGYRGSKGPAPAGYPLSAQAELIFDAIEAADAGRGSPVFLIGHSMGAILALMMGASGRGAALQGLDVSGTPLRFGAERTQAMAATMQPLIAAGADLMPLMTPEHRRSMFFGADGTFDPRVVAPGGTEHPVPVAELADALYCPERLPTVLSSIEAPVQWTIAEEENSSEGGDSVLAEARALLRNSRRVRTALQPFSGHNISLHHVARAYHLRAFAFFEECVAAWPAG